MARYVNKKDYVIMCMTSLDMKELLRCKANPAPSVEKYIVDLGELKIDSASFELEKKPNRSS